MENNQYYRQARLKRGLSELKTYLPEESGANRDIGGYNEQDRVMRFGSKHNDIYPILGDMIRWKLGLPSRNN